MIHSDELIASTEGKQMTSYGPETTTDEVLLDHDLTGRHFMITGASSGLGEESLELWRRQAPQ